MTKRSALTMLAWSAGLLIVGVLVLAYADYQHRKRSTNASAVQGVTIDLRAVGGLGELHTSVLGKSYTVDPNRLWFTAVPHVKSSDPMRPLKATLGSPVFVPLIGLGAPPDARMWEFQIPVSFPSAPGPPGMYDTQLHTAGDFGRTADGQLLVWWRPNASWPVLMWWPDESRADAALARLRSRFVGKDIYAYGGIAITCARDGWFKTYYATTPLRVRAVERDRNRLVTLWTGSTTHWGDEAALHFFANDPISVIVDLPAVKPVGLGGGTPAGTESCPSIVLADWQVDVTIATTMPPSLPNDAVASRRIRVGMSREEVAWRIGYPTELGEKAALDRETTWVYQDSLMDKYSVTFRDDKVVSFTKGMDLP